MILHEKNSCRDMRVGGSKCVVVGNKQGWDNKREKGKAGWVLARKLMKAQEVLNTRTLQMYKPVSLT